MSELLDTLSFLLCLWKDRLPCHFSMGLGRQTSVLFCKATLQDRLVCGFFMLIGIKCYMDGDTGNLQIFYGSVRIVFLTLSLLLLSLSKDWSRLALTPSLRAPGFRALKAGPKRFSSVTPGYFTRHKSASLWVGYEDMFFSWERKENRLLFLCFKQQ